MAQQVDGHQSDIDVDIVIPTPSVDINPGDIVVVSRTHDPRTLQAICTTPGRCRPIKNAWWGQWSIGYANGKFTNDGLIVNATVYAAPTINNAMKVYRRGVFRLAISNTAGKKGDYVRYTSGASGAQVFVIDNEKIGWAIGRLARDFSGATANDPQAVELIEHKQQTVDLYNYLENRVLEGCWIGAATQNVSRVRLGQKGASTTSNRNKFILQGKAFSVAFNKSFAFGGVASLTSSVTRFKWITMRSGGLGVRSCSVTKKGGTSWTNAAAVTIGIFRPVTMTAGEFPIALLVQRGAKAQTIGMIWNLRGSALIPPVGNWGL